MCMQKGERYESIKKDLRVVLVYRDKNKGYH
jgi:hypothetical protein